MLEQMIAWAVAIAFLIALGVEGSRQAWGGVKPDDRPEIQEMRRDDAKRQEWAGWILVGLILLGAIYVTLAK